MNSLTIHQAIFTGQQLCLHTLATPCRAQKNHSRSVRCTVSVFHLQVGQYYKNSIVTSVSILDYQLMNALSLGLIFEWLYNKRCCCTGIHYRPVMN